MPDIGEFRAWIESAHQDVMIHEPTRLPMAYPWQHERKYREIAIGSREGAKHALLGLPPMLDGAPDLVCPKPLIANAVDHKNPVGRFIVRRAGQRIGHVGAGDGNLFE